MAARFQRAVPVLFVPDVTAAIAYYTTKLGFEIAFTTPYNYAGIRRDGVELHVGRGSPPAPNKGAAIYFFVENLEELRRQLVAVGAIADQPLLKQDYGLYELHLTDPFGYHLAFAEPVNG